MTLVPARALAFHVEPSSFEHELLGLAADVPISVFRSSSRSYGVQVANLLRSKRRRSSIKRAVRLFERSVTTRSIEAVRPLNPAWVIPDSIGFAIEGRSRRLDRRRKTLLGQLQAVPRSCRFDRDQQRAVERVVKVINNIERFPHWLYWLSPAVVSLIRRSPSETLIEVNREAKQALRALKINASISTWQGSVGVVTRRLPLGEFRLCSG